ncbi:MAG: Alcohol dehydrogenase GroES domain protein [Ilumatobacteraceae bacterium]|nr:Alcohol dehydrogenase GroES domain protein [Ilumatobacteraceae bacterium]
MTAPSTSRAYRLLAWEQPPALVEVPAPVAGPGQVVVRVAACGLCHSDLAMMAMPAAIGDGLGWQIPFTLGHESGGWVHEVGEDVDGFAVGDPVAVASPASCGRCRWCRAGQENACASGLVGRGYGRDGGLADLLLVDDLRSLLPTGGLDPALAAPLTDAGATSYHAVRRILPRLRDDGTVVVLGVGGLGGFMVQILRALSPARIVAVDPDPGRRALAQRYGADAVLDGVRAGTGRELGALLGPDGADAVLDVVGIDDTIACGVRALAPGGAFGLVGAAGGTLRKPWYGTLPRDGELFTFQGSDLADARAVLELAAAGRLAVDVVRFPLDEAADAYAALAAGGLEGRLIVEP